MAESRTDVLPLQQRGQLWSQSAPGRLCKSDSRKKLPLCLSTGNVIGRGHRKEYPFCCPIYFFIHCFLSPAIFPPPPPTKFYHFTLNKAIQHLLTLPLIPSSFSLYLLPPGMHSLFLSVKVTFGVMFSYSFHVDFLHQNFQSLMTPI